MMRWVIIFLVSFSLFSCNSKQKSAISIQTKTDDKEVSNTVSEKVKPKYLNTIADWKEYTAFQDFLLINFEKTSTQKVISNAKDLSDFSLSLRDSIVPKEIDDPSFNARLNLLHSESLRLSDMSTISAITPKDISMQTQKVFDAFSFVNAKINSILEQQELERLYGDDVDLARIKSDKKEETVKKKKALQQNTKQSYIQNRKKLLQSKTKKKKKGKLSAVIN